MFWAAYKRFSQAVLIVLVLLGATAATAQVNVRGNVKADGTYVAPHYRSAPDGNFYNNWSTTGNVNPYTGKLGTQNSPPTRLSQPSAIVSRSLYPVKENCYSNWLIVDLALDIKPV
mgnify:CR=1 FL=1